VSKVRVLHGSLFYFYKRSWWNGRHTILRGWRAHARVGSNPTDRILSDQRHSNRDVVFSCLSMYFRAWRVGLPLPDPGERQIPVPPYNPPCRHYPVDSANSNHLLNSSTHTATQAFTHTIPSTQQTQFPSQLLHPYCSSNLYAHYSIDSASSITLSTVPPILQLKPPCRHYPIESANSIPFSTPPPILQLIPYAHYPIESVNKFPSQQLRPYCNLYLTHTIPSNQ
jgi:hypothetical protein